MRRLKEDNNNTELDIGCGLGDGIVLMNSLYPTAKFIGADFYIPALKKARKLHPDHKFVYLDLDAFVINDIPTKLDTIMVIQTLEHIEHPFVAIATLLLRCKHLMITVPKPEKGKGHPSHLWSFEKGDFKHFEPCVKEIVGQRKNRVLYIFKGTVK